MALNPFVLHVNKVLTNVSVSYRNAAFVADQIFPGIPVDKSSDDYFVFGTDSLRAVPDKTSPRARANEVIMQRSAVPYAAKEHALAFPIPDQDRSDDDLGSLEIDATMQLTDQIQLNREIDVLSQVTAGIGGNTEDLSASAYANAFDNDTSDPVETIEHKSLAIAKSIGRRPNVLVLSSPSLAGIRNNAKVKARITGAPGLDGSAITLQQLAAVLNVERVLEAAAVQNTAKEGQADAMDFVWGLNSLLCYVPKSPGLRIVSLGYTFLWNFPASPVAGVGGNQRIGDIVPGGAGYGVRMWYEHGVRTTMVEARMNYDQKVIAPGAGFLFTNTVQNWP